MKSASGKQDRLSRIPSLNHPVKREGPPNDAPFTIGNGSYTVSGNQREGDATWFLLTPLGVERTLADGRIERIVVAPRLNAHAVQRTGEPLQLHGVEEADVESWVRSHAAAAERRRREELYVHAHGTAIRDEIEWAKFRRATLPADHTEAIHAIRTINDLSTGILGIEPDPEKGRLVLAPWLPDDWQTAVVENITVGDGRITLIYEPDREAVRFEITQIAGAYPVRLIFEPALQQSIAHVFIDGSLATLDARSEGGRTRFPMQIMLDAKREIIFERQK